MRSYSPEPIWLPLRPSRRMRHYLLLLHGLALCVPLLLDVPLALRLAGVGLVMISLAVHWRRYLWLRGAGAVRCLHWRADGDCWLTDGAGRVTVYRGVAAGLMHPALTVLRLTGAGADRWVPLAEGCADDQALRRLRIRLRRAAPEEGQARPLRGR